MGSKLRKNQYSSVREFTRDFDLIFNNCFAFKGHEYLISLNVDKMRSSFDAQMSEMPKLVDPESSMDNKASKTTYGSKGDRVAYLDTPLAETLERSQTAEEALGIGHEVNVTVPVNQVAPDQGPAEPSRKGRRAEAEVHAEISIEPIRTKLELLAIAESNRAEEIAALLNDAATPQSLQSMVSMYEHTIGAEDTRAKIVFAHALKEVTAALSAAKKERTSMPKEIFEGLKAYEERE